jgi:hypothetical protein
MLLRTIFVLLLFAALAETVIAGAHALAETVLRRQAVAAVHAELAAAVAVARQAVASAVRAGGDPRHLAPVAPSPSATCAMASQNGCAVQATATVAFLPVVGPSPSPCAANTCTAYVQGNDDIAEGYVRAAIAVRALGADGTVLASRNGTATFRAFLVSPFAALAGGSDASLAALAGSSAGSDAGAVPNGTAPGSLIDVLYENRLTKQTMPGNVWRPEFQSQTAAPAAWLP